MACNISADDFEITSSPEMSKIDDCTLSMACCNADHAVASVNLRCIDSNESKIETFPSTKRYVRGPISTKVKKTMSMPSPKKLFKFRQSNIKVNSCKDNDTDFANSYLLGDSKHKRSPKKTKRIMKILKKSQQMEENIYCDMNKNIQLKDEIQEIEALLEKQENAVNVDETKILLEMQDNQNQLANELEMIVTSMEKLRLENVEFETAIEEIKWDEEAHEKVATKYMSMFSERKEISDIILKYHSGVLSNQLIAAHSPSWKIRNRVFGAMLRLLARYMNTAKQAHHINELEGDLARFDMKVEPFRLKLYAKQKEMSKMEKSLISCREACSTYNDNKSVRHLLLDYVSSYIENSTITYEVN